MLPMRISLFFNSDIPAVIITLSRGVNPVHLPIFSHTQVYCPLKEENVRGSSDFFCSQFPLVDVLKEQFPLKSAHNTGFYLH